MNINYRQNFHPVGQGLFYSSSLQMSKNVFINVVFDCGSEKIKDIKKQVETYQEVNKTKIDILIISHLHYDHISGLESLLNKKDVNTVILPYLSLEERILLQFSNLNRPSWYISFLANPYSYLERQENISNIIIIRSDDNDNDIPNDFPPEEFQIFNENSEDKTIIVRLQEVDEQTRIEIENIEGIGFNDKLSLKKDRGYISVSNLYFSIFNYQIKENKKIAAFKKEIKSMGITDINSVVEVLKNKKQTNELVKKYELLRKDLNLTSLSAFQGLILPISRNNHFHISGTSNQLQGLLSLDSLCCDCRMSRGYWDGYKNKYYFDCFCDCNHKNRYNDVTGTLLLGDIKLDYKRKDKELFNHFKNLLQSVNLIQLSHHGAENGWNDNLINLIPQNCVYIASHGLNNKYKHPHKKVMMNLIKNKRTFISVTEQSEYYSKLEIHF